MKKSRLIIALIFTFIFSLLVVACKSSSNDRVNDAENPNQSDVCVSHDYEDRGYIDTPTCTKTGLKLYVCIKCQETKEEVVDKLPHEFDSSYSFDDEVHWFEGLCGCGIRKNSLPHNFSEYEEITPATCFNVGLESRYCLDCGKIEEREIQLKDHTYEDTLSYSTGGHWYASNCGHDEMKDYESHELGVWIEYEPSGCEVSGVARRYCKCGYFEEEPTTSKGHTFSSEYSYDSANHWLEAICGHIVYGEFNEHSFSDWQIVKYATCLENGERYRACYCGYEERDYPLATGHSFETTYTYDEDAHWFRSTCEHYLFDSYSEHSYSDWQVVKEPTCLENGERYRTCYCCSEERDYPSATGHSYETTYTYDEIGHWFNSTCGHNEVKGYGTHNYGKWQIVKKATCLENGERYRVCVCGSEERDYPTATGHDFVYGDCKGCDEWYTYGLIYEDIDSETTAVLSTVGGGQIIIPEINEHGKRVVAIKDGAFDGNYYSSITIPDSVSKIGLSFRQARVGQFILNNNPYYALIGNCLVELSTKTLIKASIYSEIINTNSITKIGAYAFEELDRLNLTINSNITEIDEYAFYYCYETKLVMNTSPSAISVHETAFYEFNGCFIYLGNLYGVEHFNAFTEGNFGTIVRLYSETSPETAGYFWNYGANNELVEIRGNVAFSDNITYKLSDDGSHFIVIDGSSCYDEVIIVPNTYFNKPVKVIGENAFEYVGLYTTEIILPDNVTEIGDSAFANALVKIVLPNYVEKIGANAFKNAGVQVKNGVLPSSLIEVGNYGLYALSGVVYVPNTLTKLGKEAFNNATVMCQALAKPGAWDNDWYKGFHYSFNVVDYGEYNGLIWANEGGNNVSIVNAVGELNEIVVPATIKGVVVTKINYGAFENYNYVNRLTLPFLGVNIVENETASLHNIFGFESGEVLNGWFTNLQKVTLTNETVIGNNAFEYIPLKEIKFSDNLEKICNNAFANTNLISVTIPDTVTEIGAYAFHNIWDLVTLNISSDSALVSVGNYAFYQCNTLTIPTLPSKLESIGDWAFATTTQNVYESLVIPNNVQNIGHGAFNGVNVKALTVPFVGKSRDANESHLSYIFGVANPETNNANNWLPYSLISVTVDDQNVVSKYAFYAYSNNSIIAVSYTKPIVEIKEKAFYYASNLETFEFIDEVESIGAYAFYYASKLDNLTFTKVKSIGEYAFGYCESVTELVIPDTVEYMGANFLYGMGYNLNSLTIPFIGTTVDNETKFSIYSFLGSRLTYNIESVTVTKAKEIPTAAFSGLTSLKTVVLNNEIKIIENHAFKGCTNLTTLVLPNKLEEIGDSAFDGCYSYNFKKLPDTLVSIGQYAFKDTAFSGILHVPASVVYMYNILSGREYHVTKVIYESYKYYSWEHLFETYLEDYQPEIIHGYNNYEYNDEVNGVKLYYVINDDNTVTLTKYEGPYEYDLVIPETISGRVVRDLGQTFSSCYMTSVTIPSGVTRINRSAFGWCYNLETVKFAKNSKVEIIYDNAFVCSSLSEITIPSSVKYIGGTVFAYNDTELEIYLESGCDVSNYSEYWNSKKEGTTEDVYSCYTYANPTDENLISGTYWYYNAYGEKVKFTV